MSFMRQMDADYEENNSNEMSGKKRKRRSRLAQALKKQKPVFDPGRVFK